MCTFVAQAAEKGSFGAALMSDPEKVRNLCAAMHKGSDRSTPVTVKYWIGTNALHGGDAPQTTRCCPASAASSRRWRPAAS